MILLTPPIHPPPYQTIHPPMCGESPQISNLQTKSNYLDWLKCYWIFIDSRGRSRGWGEWIGIGVGVGVWGDPMQTCTCMHADAYTYMLNMDASMRVAICNFNTCVCVHVHACMCTCVWTPPMSPDASQSFVPSPRAAGRPKHQNSISLELIEIIRFCLKILYLWTLLNSYRL